MEKLLTSIDPWMEPIVTIIIAVGLLQSLFSAIELVVSAWTMRRSKVSDSSYDNLWAERAQSAPPIALIAPAYNEEITIVESVQSLMSIHYPNYEVIVVNDGSKDKTLQRMIDEYDLYPSPRAFDDVAPHKPIRQIYRSREHSNLIVIDKENGGKADALNAGINVSRAPLFCSVDADSMLESVSLLHAVRPFLTDPARTIAVGGTIRVANGCGIRGGRVVEVGVSNRLLPIIQTVEYIRAFLVARIALSKMGILTLISGAFGIFRRSSALAVGGYALDTVGEDYELVLRMHRYYRDQGLPYRVAFVPEPVCWTEVPESLTVLSRQRKRWQRGALETFFRHKDMLFRPRYGKVGAIALPMSLVIDVLGPIVETIGLILIPISWMFGILDPQYAIAFLIITFVYGIFISAGSLALEEMGLHRIPRAQDLLKLILVVVVENLGYRQLHNIWRVQGWWEFMRKKKGWGEMTRLGLRRDT